MRKIVVFGGAFNPPLNSHFSLAEQIASEYEEVEKIIFVPVNSNYQKSEVVISNEHRYNMLQLVCNENANFEVCDIELKSQRPLYTIETLKFLQSQYPENEIIFTTGTDNLKEFSTWYKAEELISNFKVLVLERDEDIMEKIINADEFLKKYENQFIKVKENIRSNLSSTFVREKIRRGKSIRYLLPDKVYDYIKQNKLYEVM